MKFDRADPAQQRPACRHRRARAQAVDDRSIAGSAGPSRGSSCSGRSPLADNVALAVPEPRVRRDQRPEGPAGGRRRSASRPTRSTTRRPQPDQPRSRRRASSPTSRAATTARCGRCSRTPATRARRAIRWCSTPIRRRPGVQALSHPGITNIENYLETAARVALRAELGPHVRFAATRRPRLEDRSRHHVRRRRRRSADGRATTNCETDNNDVVNPAREVNPLHSDVIDLVGHRYHSIENLRHRHRRPGRGPVLGRLAHSR